MKSIVSLLLSVVMIFSSFDVRAERVGKVHGLDLNLLGMPSLIYFKEHSRGIELTSGQELVVYAPCWVHHYVGGGFGFSKIYYNPPITVKLSSKVVNAVFVQSTFSLAPSRRRQKESDKLIVLIQPKYPHGGSGKCQTYLPGGLMNLGSRLLQAGVDVEFLDLNQKHWSENRDVIDSSQLVGFTVLGPPYITEVVNTIKEMRAAGIEKTVLVGGEGVSRLDPEHFALWFEGLDAKQVKNDEDIFLACDVDPPNLPSAYETSMVRMLKRLSADELRRYLTAEFSLFTSQGCICNCLFCAADKCKPERYRDLASIGMDVNFICKFLSSEGSKDLRVYISNLDAFQTPERLEMVVKVIYEVAKEHSITPHVRCLATSKFTLRACEADPDLPKRLRSYGMEIVAFGADGADEEEWKRQRKGHNSLSDIQTVCRAMENAGITVELLMVIGFQGGSWTSLWHGLKFSFVQALKGRIIRPYLAKAFTPSGNWPSDEELVKPFLEDSSLLTRLDYAMVGSKQTHPRLIERWAVNAVYLAIIAVLAPFGKCPTRPLFPVPKGFGRSIVGLINRLMPFDR